MRSDNRFAVRKYVHVCVYTGGRLLDLIDVGCSIFYYYAVGIVLATVLAAGVQDRKFLSEPQYRGLLL